MTERLGAGVISVGTCSGRGGGSGVILGSDGQMATAATNSHVVRGLGRWEAKRQQVWGGLRATLGIRNAGRLREERGCARKIRNSRNTLI